MGLIIFIAWIHWELLVKAVGGMVMEFMSHGVLEANRLSHLSDSKRHVALSGAIDEVFQDIFCFYYLYINWQLCAMNSSSKTSVMYGDSAQPLIIYLYWLHSDSYIDIFDIN